MYKAFFIPGYFVTVDRLLFVLFATAKCVCFFYLLFTLCFSGYRLLAVCAAHREKLSRKSSGENLLPTLLFFTYGCEKDSSLNISHSWLVIAICYIIFYISIYLPLYIDLIGNYFLDSYVGFRK